MSFIPASNLVDDVQGKIGTPERDAMEAQLKEEVHAYFVGEAIKNARLKQHLTQEELGERVGVKRSQICKLEYLILGSNELISLDISKCPALKELSCDNNEFTAEEMNKIYNALPAVESGTLACDELGDWSIAEKKGWTVELY